MRLLTLQKAASMALLYSSIAIASPLIHVADAASSSLDAAAVNLNQSQLLPSLAIEKDVGGSSRPRPSSTTYGRAYACDAASRRLYAHLSEVNAQPAFAKSNSSDTEYVVDGKFLQELLRQHHKACKTHSADVRLQKLLMSKMLDLEKLRSLLVKVFPRMATLFRDLFKCTKSFDKGYDANAVQAEISKDALQQLRTLRKTFKAVQSELVESAGDLGDMKESFANIEFHAEDAPEKNNLTHHRRAYIAPKPRLELNNNHTITDVQCHSCGQRVYELRTELQQTVLELSFAKDKNTLLQREAEERLLHAEREALAQRKHFERKYQALANEFRRLKEGVEDQKGNTGIDTGANAY